jgi:hypothetical protein
MMEVVALLKDERREMKAEMQAQRVEMRAEMDAKMEAHSQAAKLREQQVATRATAAELITLQARLEALCAAKLLTDDEHDLVEDVIADAANVAEDEQVAMLIDLSGRMVADKAFARQLRRKVTSR